MNPMKRLLLAIFFFLAISAPSFAAHIKGGFFTYEYLGPGTGTNLRYRITLTVYMICNPSSGQLSNPINFSIFDGGSNQFIQTVSVPITNQFDLSKNFDEPCITGDQRKCYYTIVEYNLPSIELPQNTNGYTIAYQRCCRIAGINNIVSSGSVGNTFTTQIPGTASTFQTNSSPSFIVNDTAVVCRNSFFQYSFQATDKDGDSLSYSFCSAYQGGGPGNGTGPGSASPDPAANPPYSAIPYQFPYSGPQPMGSGVSINPLTGIISGIAPNQTGEFVVCVCVNEYDRVTKNLKGTSRKELHVTVSDCDPLNAELAPQFTTCDGFNVSFANLAGNNPTGTEYLWTFDDPSSGANNTSTLQTPSHVFTDTGIYFIKLKVSLAGGICSDSAEMRLGVYPGFFPGFRYIPNCYLRPQLFQDTTRATYGTVNFWRWNFGDLSTLADTSRLQNPQWTYPSPGPKDITFVVASSKGCRDTITQTIDVLDKSPLNLAFKDTLICVPDAVTLRATGPGTFRWTPNVNIINANTATPTVNPTSTTKYYVDQDDNGCTNKDSVVVRVVRFVTQSIMPDTTICLGDTIQLRVISDALSYNWTPAANLNNPNIKNPMAVTNALTTYTVTGSIGSCSETNSVRVTPIPYPIATLGLDPKICYNTSVQLNGAIVGSSFRWTPTSYLNNPSVLNPFATPPRTTTYILSAFDNQGCPKPGNDTITVIVNPRVRAYAGRDTIVVINQPLQLNGSGGVNYLWSPATGLNNTTINNPVGIYTASIDSVRYKLIVTDAIGCADSAYVTVKVFKTAPSVFVPSAFTPNNDGLNDTIYPISVGIQRINYFSVFNRYGQLVFKTTADRQGWDGTISNKLQATGVYVWMVSAVDYLGNNIFLKGVVTLIR
jgi:gliding motility-associated-like protein